MLHGLPLRFPSAIRLATLTAFAALGACRPAWSPNRFPTNEQLYHESLRQFRARHYDNAILGFDRLTVNLPARDTLFAPSLYYVGRAHQAKGEWLLAAQTFTRLAETFPTDTLADDALFEAGRSYAKLWRKPSLDSQYGETAENTFRTMISLYPNSPLVAAANREIARLTEWFAQKEYENGMHYFRRKGYESAIIYFKEIVEKYPDAPTARRAMLRLAQSYRAINYREDVAEMCAALHRSYPGDGEVREICGAAPRQTTDTSARP
jgi:outer membrane protein assembly factor BamD